MPIEQKAQQSIQNQVEDELAELTEAEQAEQRKDEAIKQLREIQISLGVKQTERKKIAATIKSAGDSASEASLDELHNIDSEIELLNKTFEQIAIGGIDLSTFGVKEQKFDWREELVLIVERSR